MQEEIPGVEKNRKHQEVETLNLNLTDKKAHRKKLFARKNKAKEKQKE